MPGIEYDQLIRLVQLADRVSVNLKGSTQERLNALVPKKGFQRELLSMVQLAEEIRRTHPYEKLAGTVTQFVVGSVGGTDRGLLSLGLRLYQQYGLTRAYYSGFSPVIQTPFENLPATDPLREQRLYRPVSCYATMAGKWRTWPFYPIGSWVSCLAQSAPGQSDTCERLRLKP